MVTPCEQISAKMMSKNAQNRSKLLKIARFLSLASARTQICVLTVCQQQRWQVLEHCANSRIRAGVGPKSVPTADPGVPTLERQPCPPLAHTAHSFHPHSHSPLPLMQCKALARPLAHYLFFGERSEPAILRDLEPPEGHFGGPWRVPWTCPDVQGPTPPPWRVPWTCPEVQGPTPPPFEGPLEISNSPRSRGGG